LSLDRDAKLHRVAVVGADDVGGIGQGAVEPEFNLERPPVGRAFGRVGRGFFGGLLLRGEGIGDLVARRHIVGALGVPGAGGGEGDEDSERDGEGNRGGHSQMP
jgi:hypothetical protein